MDRFRASGVPRYPVYRQAQQIEPGSMSVHVLRGCKEVRTYGFSGLAAGYTEFAGSIELDTA